VIKKKNLRFWCKKDEPEILGQLQSNILVTIDVMSLGLTTQVAERVEPSNGCRSLSGALGVVPTEMFENNSAEAQPGGDTSLAAPHSVGQSNLADFS